MAYLHCHSCGWSQDDFWRKGGYNPISWTADLEESLFKDKIYLDPDFFGNSKILPKEDADGLYITGREFVIIELERIIGIIKNMSILTYEEWEKVKNTFKCPNCGESNWDID